MTVEVRGDRIRRIGPKVLLALGLGTLGGAAANALGLPLAWMIGAMLATAPAVIAGAPMTVPKQLRGGMVMILGVMLGSAFRPEILNHLQEWAISLSGLLFYVVIATAIVVWALTRIQRYDPVTAFFAGTPGGFNEMILAGARYGGDERVIALSHSLRVMLVVFSVPFGVGLLGDYDAVDRPAIGGGFSDLALIDAGLLLFCIIGAPIAKRLKVPAHQLVGPMIVSAAIHLMGLTEGYPPALLVGAAQIVVGSFIGCRFAGTDPRTLGPIAVGAVLVTCILMVLTVIFASVLAVVTGLPMVELLLAYAPGGLAEMSLVGLALGADAAFVSTHHIVRIMLVIIIAPPVFVLLSRRLGWKPSGEQNRGS